MNVLSMSVVGTLTFSALPRRVLNKAQKGKHRRVVLLTDGFFVPQAQWTALASLPCVLRWLAWPASSSLCPVSLRTPHPHRQPPRWLLCLHPAPVASYLRNTLQSLSSPHFTSSQCCSLCNRPFPSLRECPRRPILSFLWRKPPPPCRLPSAPAGSHLALLRSCSALCLPHPALTFVFPELQYPRSSPFSPPG